MHWNRDFTRKSLLRTIKSQHFGSVAIVDISVYDAPKAFRGST
jgi:hypothetical protein